MSIHRRVSKQLAWLLTVTSWNIFFPHHRNWLWHRVFGHYNLFWRGWAEAVAGWMPPLLRAVKRADFVEGAHSIVGRTIQDYIQYHF
jgi:hypothetical protein